MLSNLNVRNFKSIGNHEVALELKPLTILTGPNAAGKSNILESLLILSQVADLPDNYSKNLRAGLSVGKYIRYGHDGLQSIAHKGELSRKITLAISIEPSSDELQGFQSLSPFDAIKTIGYVYQYTAEGDLWAHSVFINGGLLSSISKIQVSPSSYKAVFTHPPVLRDVGVSSSDNILDYGLFEIPQASYEQLPENYKTVIRIAPRIVEICRTRLKRVFYLSPLRSGPSTSETSQSFSISESLSRGKQPTYNIESVGVGKNGEHLLDVLALVFGQRKYDDIAQKIEYWASKFGMKGIRAGLRIPPDKVTGSSIGSDYLDPYLKSNIETYLASYGSKQILSIITQLFWSKSGDVILIEEPEISLHPKSQIDLQRIFATAIQEGKQIICTTHSTFLILSLSKIIKENSISSDKIVVYHIQRGEDGGTIANALPINKEGYISGWIPSYIDVEEELFKEWEETLEKDK